MIIEVALMVAAAMMCPVVEITAVIADMVLAAFTVMMPAASRYRRRS
jgi:hypothetical protein